MSTATLVKELNGSGRGGVYRFDPPVEWDNPGGTRGSAALGWVHARPELDIFGLFTQPAETIYYPVSEAVLSLPTNLADYKEGEDGRDIDDVMFDIITDAGVPSNMQVPDNFVLSDSEDVEALIEQMGYAVQQPLVEVEG